MCKKEDIFNFLSLLIPLKSAEFWSKISVTPKFLILVFKSYYYPNLNLGKYTSNSYLKVIRLENNIYSPYFFKYYSTSSKFTPFYGIITTKLALFLV